MPGVDQQRRASRDVCRAALGIAREGETAVYFHVGVGIGLGVLIGGEIYTGAYGNAGEIAFLPLAVDDAAPDLGFGAFEWGAGAMAIARLGRRLAERGDQGKKIRELVEGDLQRIDASIVFEAASRGDPGAQKIVETVADRLCEGITAVNCILDPCNLILGGDLMKARSPLPELLRNRLAKVQPRSARRVTMSLLGEDIVALGAVQLALRFVEQNHFGEPRQIFPEVLPISLRGLDRPEQCV
jgi:glucokinase